MSYVHENQTARLAGEESYAVDLCPCGCLHVHLGAITVRLSALAFDRMKDVMNEAAQILASETVPRALKH
jgi:hypothetical protein